MSESTPSFDGPAEAEAPSSKRNVALAGGLAAALAIAASGYFFLLGGSDTDQVSAPVTPTKRITATTTTSRSAPQTPAKAVGKVIPATSTARLGRDPFLALYVAPVQTAATGVAPGATAPATTGGSTTPTVVQPQNYALKLTRVYGSGNQLTAVFSVGGKTQLAKVGSVFGATQELKLLSLQQGTKGVWTAVVQEGDGQPFDAPAGQTMYVR